LILIVGGLLYGLTGFAYMHSTFPDKEKLDMIGDRLNRMENKIDLLINRKQ